MHPAPVLFPKVLQQGTHHGITSGPGHLLKAPDPLGRGTSVIFRRQGMGGGGGWGTIRGGRGGGGGGGRAHRSSDRFDITDCSLSQDATTVLVVVEGLSDRGGEEAKACEVDEEDEEEEEDEEDVKRVRVLEEALAALSPLSSTDLTNRSLMVTGLRVSGEVVFQQTPAAALTELKLKLKLKLA
ncbi:hypothetical protein ACOMHN_010687 [Nucella lapillus]